MLLTRWVYLGVGTLFRLRLRGTRDYRRRDRTMALYAPASLLVLPAIWMGLILVGFAGVIWSLGVHPWQSALLESGSSLFTLGFRLPFNLATGLVDMTEAGFGLGLLALMISYLPAIYGCYSRRELLVTALETEAGSPPSAAELLGRLQRVDGLPLLDTYWADWTRWFNDLEETHCSTPILVFFRSPAPERSWVTAAGAVLDSAALVASTFEVGERRGVSGAELCIRSGYLALRRIGDYFVMPYDPDPRPTDPIRVSRAEFDDVCRRLSDAGAKLKDDRDQAWRDFAGWRVCYEAPLLQFASLCMAPWAPWSTDRAVAFRRLPVTRRRARVRM
jgi:hypothetical protein